MRILIAFLILFLCMEVRASEPVDCASALVTTNPSIDEQIEELLDQYNLTWLNKKLGLIQALPPRRPEPPFKPLRMASQLAQQFQNKGISLRLTKTMPPKTQLISRPGYKELTFGEEFFSPRDFAEALEHLFRREEKLEWLRTQDFAIQEPYVLEVQNGELLVPIHGRPLSQNRFSRLVGKAEQLGVDFFIFYSPKRWAICDETMICISEASIDQPEDWEEFINHELIHFMSRNSSRNFRFHRNLFFCGPESSNKVFELPGYETHFWSDEVEAHFRQLAVIKNRIKATGQIPLHAESLVDMLENMIQIQYEILGLIPKDLNSIVETDWGSEVRGVATSVLYRGEQVFVRLWFPPNSSFSLEEKRMIFLETIEKRREAIKGYLERIKYRRHEFEQVVQSVKKRKH